MNYKNKKISLLALDFDGTLTDNRVLVLDNGHEAVFCNRSDGLGIEYIKKEGVAVIIISKEKNPVVGHRAEKLNVCCLQGIDDKVCALEDYCRENNICLDEVAYAGNDLNDIEVMKKVGIAIAVNDAEPEVKNVANIVLKKKGGEGIATEIYKLFW